jgi:hypothetical protein
VHGQLEQMNEVVAGLMAALPPKTLLVVLGDHGMTAEGDHGGDTAAETGAALFVYAHTYGPVCGRRCAQASSDRPGGVCAH